MQIRCEIYVELKGAISMLKLPVLEFFIRGLPEGILLVFSIYCFSKTSIEIGRYSISAILMAIAGYAVRLMPIHYGVHTILNIIIVSILTIFINKIKIMKAIKAIIITVILESICEGINLFIIYYILRIDINNTFKNPILKTMYGIPSLIIFGIIVLVYYKMLLNQEEIGDV